MKYETIHHNLGRIVEQYKDDNKQVEKALNTYSCFETRLISQYIKKGVELNRFLVHNIISTKARLMTERYMELYIK